MAEFELAQAIRPYKYKIEQTTKGARVTVHGDGIDQVVAEYATIRTRLEQEGFKIAPETD